MRRVKSNNISYTSMNFCDHEHPQVKEIAAKLRADIHGGDYDVAFAIVAFNWVRDEIKYSILADWTVPVEYTLSHRVGNCGTKACLLSAILRAGGIQKDDIGFGVERIATGDAFFLVPAWVVKACSERSIHFTLIVNLKEKWIHLDTSLDSTLTTAVAHCGGWDTAIFDGENHAVTGGHKGFDPSHVTFFANIDEFMRKKSRVPVAFRHCFNLALDYARNSGSKCSSKQNLCVRVEHHLLRSHRDVCQEVFSFLTQQSFPKQ